MLNETNKLNTITLSGMIIGPILGSGVILLPPLLYTLVDNYSLYIWFIISFLGFIFALIFGKLAILYPGDGGVSLATKEIMGKKYQLLTSFYLIFAVFFGPIAVLLTAAKFLQDYFPSYSLVSIAVGLYIITYILLTYKLSFLAKLMLFVTSIVTIVFLISSINILINVKEFTFTLPIFVLKDIGYSLLLVFWAIVGWEVIGNYSSNVKTTKTITHSIIFSATIVALVYILLGLAIVFGNFNSDEEFKLVWVIQPIFQEYSSKLLTSITVMLCIGTILLFIGGVARLISSLKLTTYTSKHINSGAPIGALNFLASIHIVTLALVYFDILDTASLVAFSDGFFIANAIIGLITAIIIFKNGFLRYSAMVLVLVFFTILLFANKFILLVILALLVYTIRKKQNN